MIETTNIQEACEYILVPPEPITFRNSSLLLSGVVRVYSQQTNYLYCDLNQVILTLKQAFQSMNSQVIMHHSVANKNLITLDKEHALHLDLVFKVPKPKLKQIIPPSPVQRFPVQPLSVHESPSNTTTSVQDPLMSVEDGFLDFLEPDMIHGLELDTLSFNEPPQLERVETHLRTPPPTKKRRIKRTIIDIQIQLPNQAVEDMINGHAEHARLTHLAQEEKKKRIRQKQHELAQFKDIPSFVPQHLSHLFFKMERPEISFESFESFEDQMARDNPPMPWHPSGSSAPSTKSKSTPATMRLQELQDVSEQNTTLSSEIDLMVVMDKESSSFLQYCEQLMKQVGTNFCFLSDIIRDEPRSVATRAFYDVLVLGTTARIRIEQQEPFAEPETRIVKDVDVKFSIDDLQEQKTTLWEGVRNYEARNNLKQMKVGDLCLYYHSNCKVPGIVGVARVIQQSLVDHSAFDEAHPYYDPKSKPDNPRWFTVQVEFVRKFERLIPLKELQKDPKLKDMVLLKKSRLSVQPTTKDEFEYICSL